MQLLLLGCSELLSVSYQCSEGEKGKTSKLEALLCEGDTDDGNAENDTNEVVNKRKDRADRCPYNVCKGMSLVAGIYRLAEGPTGPRVSLVSRL